MKASPYSASFLSITTSSRLSKVACRYVFSSTCSATRLVDLICSLTFELFVICVALYFFVLFLDAVILVLSTFFTSSSVRSGYHIFQIGTVICFDINFARLILWYIPIFHLVTQANIFGANCSSIFSNGIAKYLDICSGIINDYSEYSSVTVRVASVILAIRFYPCNGWCRSVLRSYHNSLMTHTIPRNTR